MWGPCWVILVGVADGTVCRDKSGQDCRDQSPGILDAVHVAWILLPNHSFISCKTECITVTVTKISPIELL